MVIFFKKTTVSFRQRIKTCFISNKKTMIKQYITQALAQLRQQPIISAVSIIGTALAIFLIMLVVMMLQVKTAPFAQRRLVVIAYRDSDSLGYRLQLGSCRAEQLAQWHYLGMGPSATLRRHQFLANCVDDCHRHRYSGSQGHED